MTTSRYVLSCACGRHVPVELRQAGERVPCACGATLVVPTLRELRQLPTAPTTDDRPAAPAAWGARQGVISAALIAAVLLAGAAALTWFTEPSLPKFDAAAWTRATDERVMNWTPADGWRAWVDSYVPLAETGFWEYRYQNEAAIRQQIGRRRVVEVAMLIVSGILFAAAAGMAVARK